MLMDLEDEIASKTHRYHVEGVVGEGAYGVVLKCVGKRTGEVVAIKKFKDTEDDETVRKTILREVKILRLLRHGNIVSLKDAFRRKKRLYLVFEYMQRNLLQVLEEKPLGLDADLVQTYIYQLIRAIQYCHHHEIVHRDIKPENLLVNYPNDPTLKLCDFGFARSVQGGSSSQLTDYVATRWYRAPELLLGLGNYGKPVDLWAIGCIMGELVDAQPLFPGESDIDQLFVIRKVLGPLTENQREMFLRNPRFLGMKLPEVGRKETLARRYHGKVNSPALDMIKRLLEMDESKRITIDEAAEHPYLEVCRRGEHLKHASDVKENAPDDSQTHNSMRITGLSGDMSSNARMGTSSFQYGNGEFGGTLTGNKYPPSEVEWDHDKVLPKTISSRRDPIPPSRNPPITPPLITHDQRDLFHVGHRDKRKRKDLRSRGGGNDGDRNRDGRRSRHVKYRQHKNKRRRHHQRSRQTQHGDDLELEPLTPRSHLGSNTNNLSHNPNTALTGSAMSIGSSTTSNSSNASNPMSISSNEELNSPNPTNFEMLTVTSHHTDASPPVVGTSTMRVPEINNLFSKQMMHDDMDTQTSTLPIMNIMAASATNSSNSSNIASSGKSKSRRGKRTRHQHHRSHHQHSDHNQGSSGWHWRTGVEFDRANSPSTDRLSDIRSSHQQRRHHDTTKTSLQHHQLPHLGRSLTELGQNGDNSESFSGRNHILRSRQKERERKHFHVPAIESPRMYINHTALGKTFNLSRLHGHTRNFR